MQLGEFELKKLFHRGLDGDQAAYREFLTQMCVLLRAYARRQLSRVGKAEHDAEDIVQESLLAIHAKRHAYDPSVPITAWAHALTRYKLIDFLRSTNRALGTLSLDQIEDVAANDDSDIDVLMTVRAAVASLPERMRRPIELMKLKGLSAGEVAASVGTSEVAVRVNVYRGLKAVARRLGEEP